jgi:hypothetical protein
MDAEHVNEKHEIRSETDTSSIYERKPLKLQGTRLLALAFSTLGIIYSDIGACRLVDCAFG